MALIEMYDDLTARLRASGDYIWPLLLRVIMAWEFWESGVTKLDGKNWFGDVPWAAWQVGFPFPFNSLSVDLNWLLATWGEIIFALMLLFGLFTRFAAFSLLVITVVAMIAVHWPAEWSSLSELWKGYAITAKGGFGNFKLPLLFMIMLLPLVYHGGGKLSIDQILNKITGRGADDRRINDLMGLGLGLIVLGIPLIYMFAMLGGIILLAGIILFLLPRFI